MSLESEIHAKHIARVDALTPDAPKLSDATVLRRFGMDTSKRDHQTGIVLLETEYIPNPLAVLRSKTG
jgi:hypothetical protein